MKPRGDWCFSDGTFLTLKQVLREWSPRFNEHTHKRLQLISDSCYSGSWVKALNRCHQRKEYVGVDMIAACPSNETTSMSNRKGSYFTKAICHKCYHFNTIPKCTRSLSMSQRLNLLTKFTVSTLTYRKVGKKKRQYRIVTNCRRSIS